MPVFALVAAALIGTGVSAYESEKSTNTAKKAADNQAATLKDQAAKQDAAAAKAAADAAAAPGIAEQAAKDAATKRRRVNLLSGGQTDITGDTLGGIGSGAAQVKSLLGA